MAFIARIGATNFPTSGQEIRVYRTGTTDLVTGLVDLDGTALNNPFTLQSTGFWGFTPPTRDQVDVYWVEGDRNVVEKAVLKDPDSPAEVGMPNIVAQVLSLLGTTAQRGSGRTIGYDEMGFLTVGTSFAPLIEVEGAPDVLWTFADGSTSTDLHPVKNYGAHAAERLTTLTVTPWSALKIINLGFAAADGGTTANGLALHDTQPVTDVYNLHLAAPSLAHWAACGCNINTLCFDDFVMLEEMEMYGSTGLEHISMKNCPSLYRFCIENCRCHDYVNFSGCPAIADIRGAANVNYHGPIFHETLGAPLLWHLCIRSNPQFDLPIPYDKMPLLRELFLWSSGCTGHIAPNTTVGTSFLLSSCNYTSGDFSGCFQGSAATLNISANPNLAALSVANNPSLATLDASGCALPGTQIDQILVDLVAAGRTNGTLDLSGGSNGEASQAAGQPAIDTLLSRGWTVTCAVEHQPMAILAASDLDFGNVSTVTQADISVVNNGSLATTPTSVVLSDDTHFTIITDHVTGNLMDPGETATITIEFDGAGGDFDESITVNYESAVGVPGTLTVLVGADNTTASNQIQFTTTDQTCDCAVVADGATVTWHFADGTEHVGADPGVHNFGSAGTRTENYITIDPPDALTRINFNGAACNVSEIHNLPDFPMLNYVYVYLNTDFHVADFTGLSALRQMHMNNTGMSAAEVDAMFIQVAAATPASVSSADFYCTLPRTSASDAARATLQAAGWVMHV